MNRERLQKLFVILTALFVLVQFLGNKYIYIVGGYNLIEIIKYILVAIICIVSLVFAKNENKKMFKTLLIAYVVLFSLTILFKIKGLT